MYTVSSLHVLHDEGSFVGTVSCSARWTGWLVQVTEAEGLRGLDVVVMMVNLVGRRQAVAVPQDNRGWAYRWGSPAGDAVCAARDRCLLTALLPIQVPSPFGPRVLEPNLCERRRILLQEYSVIWTKWENCAVGNNISHFPVTNDSAAVLKKRTCWTTEELWFNSQED